MNNKIREAVQEVVWESGMWESPTDGIVAISHSRLRAMFNEYGKNGHSVWYRLHDSETLAFGITLDGGCYPFVKAEVEEMNDNGPTGNIFVARVWLNPNRSLIESISE